MLREVNARPFAALVREPLARASFAKHVAGDLETVLARLAEPAPLEKFLETMRRGAAAPKVKVRAD